MAGAGMEEQDERAVTRGRARGAGERGEPKVVTSGGAIELAMPDGSRWSVEHYWRVHGVLIPLSNWSDEAEVRVFKAAAGERRRYDLGPDESRELDARLLAIQLRAARTLDHGEGPD